MNDSLRDFRTGVGGLIALGLAISNDPWWLILASATLLFIAFGLGARRYLYSVAEIVVRDAIDRFFRKR